MLRWKRLLRCVAEEARRRDGEAYLLTVMCTKECERDGRTRLDWRACVDWTNLASCPACSCLACMPPPPPPRRIRKSSPLCIPPPEVSSPVKSRGLTSASGMRSAYLVLLLSLPFLPKPRRQRLPFPCPAGTASSVGGFGSTSFKAMAASSTLSGPTRSSRPGRGTDNVQQSLRAMPCWALPHLHHRTCQRKRAVLQLLYGHVR
eukprot:scaffold659_cov329-Prasinococcus_capsulatus_cf.AAC.36